MYYIGLNFKNTSSYHFIWYISYLSNFYGISSAIYILKELLIIFVLKICSRSMGVTQKTKLAILLCCKTLFHVSFSMQIKELYSFSRYNYTLNRKSTEYQSIVVTLCTQTYKDLFIPKSNKIRSLVKFGAFSSRIISGESFFNLYQNLFRTNLRQALTKYKV